MRALTIGILLTVAVSACVSAPRPDAARMAAPAGYAAAAPPPETTTADGVAQRFDFGQQPLPEWWHAYRSQALDALVAEGLQHSPSLAAAQQTLKATHEQLRAQIGNNLVPSIDVGFAPSRQRALTIPTLPQPTFLYDVFALEAQASYRFDFFGAAVHADRALAQQVEQQAFQFEATRRALATNIVVATINAAALNESLEATEMQSALAEQGAQQLAAREHLGGVSHDEALAAEQSAAALAAGVSVLRAQLLAMRYAQAVLLGRSPDQAPEALALESLTLPDEVPLAIPTDLLRNRPDILAAEAGVHSAANQAGAAAALLYPSVSLSAAYGRGGFNWETFTSPAGAIWSVGATLSQPVFHGGALRAQKRQYVDLFDAAQSAYRQTVLAAFENVADTLAALEQDALTLAQSGRAAVAAQQTLLDTQARYRLGALPWSSALMAGQQFQNARVALVRARAARLVDTAALFQAMGEPSQSGRHEARRD